MQTEPTPQMMLPKLTPLYLFSILLSLCVYPIPLQASLPESSNAPLPSSTAVSEEISTADRQHTDSAYGKFHLSSAPLWEADFQATPAWMQVHNRLLYVGSMLTKRISSYDTVSGLQLWSSQLSAPATAPPLFYDSNLTVATKDCSILGLNSINGEINYWILPFPYDRLINFNKNREETSSETGETGAARALAKARQKAEDRRFRNQLLRLNFGSLPRLSYSSPCFGKNGIICLSGDGVLVQLDTKGANPDWNLLKCGSLQNKLFISTPAAIYNQKNDLLCAVTLDGTLWTIDLQNTEKAYQQTVGKGNLEFRSPIRLVKDLLYLTSMDGTIFCYAINSTDGGKNGFQSKLIWELSLPKSNAYQVNSEGYFISDPSFDLKKPRCFFARRDNKIISVSSLSGHLLWSCEIPCAPASPVVYWNGSVLAATEQKTLLVIDAEAGKIKKEYQLPFVPFCPPVVNDNRLYIVSKEGNLACFEIRDTAE